MATEPATSLPNSGPTTGWGAAAESSLEATYLLDLRQAVAEHAARRLAWIGRFRDLLDAWERDEQRETRRLAVLIDGALPSYRGAAGDAFGTGLSEQVQAFERALIREALVRTGQQRRAAALLGVSPSTLNEKIKRLRVLDDVAEAV